MTLPPEFWVLVPLLAATGVLSGFLAGLLGIGGGIILVPALYYIFSSLSYAPDVLMHMAVGTSLAVIVPTGYASARAHARRGAVDGNLVRQMGGGILVGVFIGTLAAGFLPGEALKLIFALAILVLSVIMFLDPRRFARGAALPGTVMRGLAGSVIGAVSSLIGIGGATLSVPYMCFYGVSLHRAVGTASALGLVISVPAMLGFVMIGLDAPLRPPFSIGYINLLAFSVIAPLAALVAPAGAHVAHSVPVARLRLIFAFFMVVVSLRMIYDALL